MKKVFALIIVFYCSQIVAQQPFYATFQIPENLKENSNSIIRNQSIDVNIHSRSSATISTLKVVTVLNKFGLKNIDATEYYDKSRHIKSIEATVYNAFGKELKKIKRKEFKDQSVADGFSVLTDNRILYFEYTPTEYPLTVVFESEIETSNTAFLPKWFPIDDYFESVEKSSIKVTYPSDLGFKYKEINFDQKNVIKKELSNSISFTIENLPAEKSEEYAPSFDRITPQVLFALEKFSLENVDGTAKNWEDFGAWMYNSLLSDTEELSEETLTKIKNLIGTEIDPIKKAKLIYKFVQDRTRYVSIQLGIGGWKPMLAKDVDRLGYGDCKALSNYTRVLLKSVGVDAYYTVIYGDKNIRNFQSDFVSMQGNHAVLILPTKDKNLVLECTSQITPFGFGGRFTDDRYALMVKDGKGELIKTIQYPEQTSLQITKAKYSINEMGTLEGEMDIQSKGIQYDYKYTLDLKSKTEIDDYYKENLRWINNLKIQKIKLNNDKDNVVFTENIQISAENYASINGATMMFPLNAFNQSVDVPQRYRTRRNPFEVARGFYDQDETEISFPQGYTIDAKPDNYELKDKFGTYKMEIIVVNPSKIIYKRTYIFNKGSYEKSEYEDFRKFKELIARIDNSKIVLIKK